MRTRDSLRAGGSSEAEPTPQPSIWVPAAPVSQRRDAGQRHADYLKLTVATWSYGLGSHRMRESRIRCDCFPGGIVVVSRGLAVPGAVRRLHLADGVPLLRPEDQ